MSQIASHAIICFFSTKATVKLANVKTVHAQLVGIVLCHFPNCSIIYPVVTVYYFSGNLSNTISLGALKFDISFKRLHLNLLNILTFLTLKVAIGDPPTILKTI